jgi:hypothetical protein
MKHLALVSSLAALDLLACGGSVDTGLAIDGGHDVTRSSAASFATAGSGAGSGVATTPMTSFGPPTSSASTGVFTGGSFTVGSTGFGGSTGGTTGFTSTGGSTGASTAPLCYSPPTVLYPEDGGTGVYCPFSTPGPGSPNIFCADGQHCCETPEAANTPSTCEPPTTACPIAGSTDWECEGTLDCVNAGKPGTICCGTGTILQQAPQPGCGPDGGTLAAYPYVTGFTGTTCQTSCATVGDAGSPGFPVCSKNSECTTVCIPIKPKGNAIGYCASPPG